MRPTRAPLAAIVAVALLAPSAAHAENKAWTALKAVVADDLRLVLGVNVETIVKSSLVQSVAGQFLSQPEVAGVLEEVKSTCGIDGMSAVRNLAVATRANEKGILAFELAPTLNEAKV